MDTITSPPRTLLLHRIGLGIFEVVLHTNERAAVSNDGSYTKTSSPFNDDLLPLFRHICLLNLMYVPSSVQSKGPPLTGTGTTGKQDIA